MEIVIESLIPIFAILSTFGSIFGMFYIYFTLRHKERMAIIENGLDISIFGKKEQTSSKRWVLRLALAAMGLGLGILLAFLLIETVFAYNSDKSKFEDVVYTAMIFLCTGLGLLSSYLIEIKLDKNANLEDRARLEA